ncbi:hypothetical protein GGR53DRAFT_479310 [Hypoxylon sp. FL1150]|nr:hypothetical protein GGR53DRAFT_479310 [Hypoxylon sp. FL1150]
MEDLAEGLEVTGAVLECASATAEATESGPSQEAGPVYGIEPVYGIDSVYGIAPGRVPAGGFPLLLNAYLPNDERPNTYYFGENSHQAPFTLTIMHGGVPGSPWMELRSGPNPFDPLVATIENLSKWNWNNAVVRIFPHPWPAAAGGSSSFFAPQQPQPGWQWSPQTVRVEFFRFSAEVGRAPNVRREQFEWRLSHGAETQQLDQQAKMGCKRR